MDTDKQKHYENRIYNLQWLAAKDYDFDVDIIGQNIDANPDFYLNLIIGLAYKYFGKENISNLLEKWSTNLWRNKYDMALIYLLEQFIYNKEVTKRPVLESLRKEYANTFLDDRYDLNRRNLALKENLIYRLEIDKCREILNIPTKSMTFKYEDIKQNFKLSNDTDSLNLNDKVLSLFKKYLSFKENSYIRNIPNFSFLVYDKARLPSLIRSNKASAFGKSNKSSNILSSFILNFRMKKNLEQLSKIERTFGKSMFDEELRLNLEKDLCTGPHRKSRIYFTKGIENADKNLDIETNQKTVSKHMTAFKKNENTYKAEITNLSKRIKLKLNQVSDFDYQISNKGKLIAKLAYKTLISNRANIFAKKSLVSIPNIKFDLIVDGSASILNKETDIAIATYILSKSLENNNIANRVISYQSIGDFTILTVLKDYNQDSDIKRIFRFKAMGWNRDGLAFKAYRALIDRDSTNTFSIILTDANPSDFRAYINKGIKPNTPYQDKCAIDDTKRSLDYLRKKGLDIAAILSSENIDIAKTLFRNKYIKIDDISQFSNACSKLINKQISKIEKR